jgi:hypothetical protein
MSGTLALFLGSEVDACSRCTVDASIAATESPHLVVGIGKKNPLSFIGNRTSHQKLVKIKFNERKVIGLQIAVKETEWKFQVPLFSNNVFIMS